MINASGRALLCDFGFSRIRHDFTRTHSAIRAGGPALFVPPEYSEQEEVRPNEDGDMYSFAMTILKLGTRADPFEGEFDHGARKNGRIAIKKAQEGIRPRKPLGMGDLPSTGFDILWCLLEKMWAHIPDDRPAASAVVDDLRDLKDEVSFASRRASFTPEEGASPSSPYRGLSDDEDESPSNEHGIEHVCSFE